MPLFNESDLHSRLGHVFLGADCKASLVQRFCKYMIQKELVALTGIEPVFKP
jgi:hypothetical protein